MSENSTGDPPASPEPAQKPKKKSPEKGIPMEKTWWWLWLKRLTFLGGIVFGLYQGLAWFGWAPDLTNKQPRDLVVFVHGADGPSDRVLVSTGKVLLDFGADRRERDIGADGSAHFGEIPEAFRGKEISLHLAASGFEAAEPGQKYRLDGQPVYLRVRRDNSLGDLRGTVKNRDGRLLLAGTLVLVDSDTTAHTDSPGAFRLRLPEHMQRENYLLTVKKDGYEIKTEHYFPKSGPVEIRLEKQR